MSQFTSLTIKAIIKETPSAVSLVFEIPPEKQDRFSFVAGQFLTLKAFINGEEVRRAYSISSHPNQENIQISIKKIANGKFSTYVNETLQVGDQIEVMVPEGKFKLHPNKSKQNYIAFAAGSGITPIMSMIKTVLLEEKESKFVLVYGNKNSEETMFSEELITLQKQNPSRLFIEFIYSRENIENSTFGRIEKSIVNLVLKNKYKDIVFNDFFLCGPEGMINTVKDVLLENGISEKIIHFELFTTSNTSEIITNNQKGTSSVFITVDDEEFEIQTNKNVNLLDAVLNNDIDAPYSCKGGVCCSCICRVTEGEVHMPINNLLTDSEIAEGLVLACQAYAKSNLIKIDFDDA